MRSLSRGYFGRGRKEKQRLVKGIMIDVVRRNAIQDVWYMIYCSQDCDIIEEEQLCDMVQFI